MSADGHMCYYTPLICNGQDLNLNPSTIMVNSAIWSNVCQQKMVSENLNPRGVVTWPNYVQIQTD